MSHRGLQAVIDFLDGITHSSLKIRMADLGQKPDLNSELQTWLAGLSQQDISDSVNLIRIVVVNVLEEIIVDASHVILSVASPNGTW